MRDPAETAIEDTCRFLERHMQSESWMADPDIRASDMRATADEIEASNLPDYAKHYAIFAVLEQTKKRRGKPTRSHRDDAIRRVAIKLIRRAASFAKHCAVSARSYRKNQSMPSWRKIPARSFIKHKVSPAFFEYRFCPFNDDMGIKRRRRMPHERRRRLYRENVQAGQRDLLERQPRRHRVAF